MNPSKFFTGRTEVYLLNVLKEKGSMHFTTIYGSYSNKTMARNFINKLLTFEVAVLADEANVLKLKVEELEENKV